MSRAYFGGKWSRIRKGRQSEGLPTAEALQDVFCFQSSQRTEVKPHALWYFGFEP